MGVKPPSSPETKLRILEAAMEILDHEGATGITTRRVADRVGISSSVVTHHFESKQGLLDACKDHVYDHLVRVILSALGEAGDRTPRAIAEALVRDVFSAFRNRRGVCRLVFGDIFATGETVARYRNYETRPLTAIVDQVIAPALGIPTEDVRVRLQAIAVLIARFAISSELDLEAVLGYRGEPAVAAIEEHVVRIALAILFAP